MHMNATIKRGLPVVAAMSAAALLALSGTAQAATGTATFAHADITLTNPVNGTCYNLLDSHGWGAEGIQNNTDTTATVYQTSDCSGAAWATPGPGQWYGLGYTWFPVAHIGSVKFG
jgi:hypothetical protein